MNNSWLQKRQNIFIRDLVEEFVNTKIFFDKILNEYKTSLNLPYKRMETWVGSEKNKGPLWLIKDLSHRLIRNNAAKKNLYEQLFDWTIGSIFHEAIKLKENTYQINSYKPLLDFAVNNYKHDKKLSRIINDNFKLIEKAGVEVKNELDNISGLFTKAVMYLKEIFIIHKDNELLLKYLIENKTPLEKVFLTGAQESIFAKMFENGTNDALLYAARKMRENGWYEDSEKYLKKADLNIKLNHKL